MRAALFIAALAMTSQAAHAGPPELVWPLDCELGNDCYIEDYMDHDPSTGKLDYTCSIKTRDGHRGTDIVLDGFVMMKRGVSVLAAADGIVSAARDGEPDEAATASTLADLSGRECGNAVRITHADGWQTLYCHLRKDSVLVRQGNIVKAGEPLGLVGMSGKTNLPHLHFGVLHLGRSIDPFHPATGTATTCGPDRTTLWATPPAYQRTGFYTAAMTTGIPAYEHVRSGEARKTSARPDQPLVIYGYMHHAETGDVLHLSASGPQGEIFSSSEVLKAPKRSQFKAFGRKAPPAGWPVGRYRGVVRLTRAGALIAWRHADIEVISR